MLSNRGLGIKTKKCLYGGIIVPIAFHGGGTWGMRSAERRTVNVLEIKCLRVRWECHERIELLMDKCVVELELEGSWRAEWSREY